MRQHVFAFVVALAVWGVSNLIGFFPAQQLKNEVCIRPAVSLPTPNARVIVTDDARCVQSTECEAWYLYSCSGYLPNCNGGCWIIGPFTCSACIQEEGQTCVQEQVVVRAPLRRYDCTSSNGYNCNACNRNSYTPWGYLDVTTFRCR
ncbi:MAG: hypothetical protein KatS3mg022_1564 [Armatimonadota bacterium]|nr:MAG: hypothetical protein KatS3mg022_1564 [Armatimonadota bacterium]